ncbi:hypothetical protein BKA69DRAFT_1075193 [Paraphysoderma sedebokerense]|nr:hypothetical protein BKA69DRAFT_1075193 [Paraphysoderma sedebokerense]
MSSQKVSAVVGLWILLAISTTYHQVSCAPVRTGNRIQESDPHLKCYQEILSAESRSKRNWDDHSSVEACGFTHIGYFGSCSNHKLQFEQKVAIPSTSGTTENRIDKGLGDGRLYLFDSAFVAADHAWGGKFFLHPSSACSIIFNLTVKSTHEILLSVCEREVGSSSSSSSPTLREPMVCMLYMPTKLLPTLQKLYFPAPSPEDMIQSFEYFVNVQTSQTVRFGKITNLPGNVYPDLLYSAWPNYATDRMKAFCSVLTEADVLGMGDQKLVNAKTGYKDILKHAKWGHILTRLPDYINN